MKIHLTPNKTNSKTYRKDDKNMLPVRSSVSSREVLTLIAGGALITGLFLMPAAAVPISMIIRAYQSAKREQDLKELNKFNYGRLRFILNRLAKQGTLEEKALSDGTTQLVLTQKGKSRLYRYRLEDMKAPNTKTWDGKWRIIMYDIASIKRREQEQFRRMLKKLNLMRLQKSVYLTPYPINSEIEFLRYHFGIADGVVMLTVQTIENEWVYREYFGLI